MLTTILQNVGWRFIKGIAQFFSMILIVRNINLSDYGWYISAISTFELAAILSIPGVVKIALRSALADDKRFDNLFTLKLICLPVIFLGLIIVQSGLAIFILLAVVSDQISSFARVRLNQHKQYFVFNLLECLKPLLLILCILLYLTFIETNLSITFLAVTYFLLSFFTLLLNIYLAKRLASFSINIEKPSFQDFINSVYASGNGLIAIAIRRGSIIISAYTLSYTDAAYLNIALQFLTIFTMIYSGISLSLTRDLYDINIKFAELRNNYSFSFIILMTSIIASSLILYYLGGPILNYIFGKDLVGASDIIFMTPLILLFQLPQLILMGVFMRHKKEKTILILNIFLILIFTPVGLFYSVDIASLILLILFFVICASLLYIATYIRFYRYKVYEN